MKKYKQVLATLMAANLIVSTVTIDAAAGTTEVVVRPIEKNQKNTAEVSSQSSETSEKAVAADSEESSTDNDSDTGKNENSKESVKEDNSSSTKENTENKSAENKSTENKNTENAVKETAVQADINTQAGTLTIQQLITDGVIPEGKVVRDSSGKITSVTIDDGTKAAEQMIKLSNCADDELAKLTINLSVTGQIDLSAAKNGYTYRPLGSGEGFTGTLNGSAQIILNQPLFNVVNSSATVSSGLSILWAGNGTVPMYANTYIFGDTKEHELPLAISAKDKSVTMGSLIGTVGKSGGNAGTFIIGNKIIYGEQTTTSNLAAVAPFGEGNTGLLCGSLLSGTVKLNGYKFPTQSYTVTSNKGNAGGLIGGMGEYTSLDMTLSSDVTLNESVTASAGSAGGLVGVSGENANYSVSGTGKMILKNLTVKGKKTVGGVFGSYTLNGGTAVFPKWLIFDENKVSTELTGGSTGFEQGIAGGLFGVLNLENGAEYTIQDVNLSNTLKGNGTAYGAVAGQVKSDSAVQDKLSALKICSSSDDEINEITSTNKNRTYYHGGLIGLLGERATEKAGDDAGKAVYLEVANTAVTISNPYAGDGKELGFGGIVGHEAAGSVIKLDKSIKVSTKASDPRIWEGGGLVGYAGKGSALELNGTTDLSETSYESRGTVGQLVGKQDNALIYARGDGTEHGWVYKRAKKNNISNKDQNGRQGALDDIGNYGQVIRLKDKTGTAEKGLSEDLITLDSTSHKVTIQNGKAYTGDTITLNNAEEFALLAITWQSQGTFSADEKLTDWTTFKSKNIILSGDVDLTGTGITGLTRDNTDDANYQYTGQFDGGTHTITLASGEAYGWQENVKVSGDSSGMIHRHYYQGIFGSIDGNSSVKNLKIKGAVYTDPMPVDRTQTVTECWVGGYAGKVTSSSVTVNGVTVEQKMNISADRTFDKVKGVYAGGLFGQITSAATIEVGNESQTEISPKITIMNSDVNTAAKWGADSADVIYAGGLAGYLMGDKAIKVNCDDIKLAGKITCDSTEKKVQAGGLIGYAEYNTGMNGTAKTINVKKIEVDDQTVSAKKAVECGGLLGYLWADTNVNFITPTDASKYALSVKNATVDMQGSKASAGGLVYRGSGQWMVNDRGISLKNSTLKAKNLGFLVCHAEIDESQVLGNGDPDTNRQKALYLEMTENWEKAYELEKITVDSSGVTDEIIAYTASSAAGITTNYKNGVISLATENHAGVAKGKACNTYENRILGTDKTNDCSRYYYNLDTLRNSDKVNNGTDTVDTPEKLLIWSVRRYTSNNLKDIFGSECWIVGTNDSAKPVNLDMEGLSYYPVNVNAIIVKNANIKFYNNEIENLETDNKSTKGSAENHTQHYMMHCGLFYNMNALTAKYDPNRNNTTASAENVHFSGTIGKVNGGSGALACGIVSGQRDTANITNNRLYTLTVKNVCLDDIKVTGEVKDWEGYAPVLINSSGNYSTINFNNIYTDNYDSDKKAGTSLMGNAGGEDMTQISLSFSHMHLPDTTDGIFTQATFLNKFQYSASGVGSGIYNFEKNEEWDADGSYTHNATYGKEISDSQEYAGLQSKYYDIESQNAENDGYVNATDTKEEGSFGSYLPYVKVGNTQNLCHEIRVNQRLSDLLDGCGTYGHPYKITSDKEMTTISNYLSQGNAQTDWKVTITGDQTALNNENDTTYRYTGSVWQHVEEDENGQWSPAGDGKELDDSVMQSYLLSAYYDIQGKGENKTLTLTNFTGFGTEDHPFRGVIVSTTGSTIELAGTVSTGGLIGYSYGSVVKDINIHFTGNGQTVTYNKAADDDTEARYQPQNIFGGVIGCVMGGDNIIDNVTVTVDASWKLTLDGNKNYLIQAGGYVGSIAGGGVIFRKEITDDWLTGHVQAGTSAACTNISTGGSTSDEKATSLYVNPIVGRVLDGYAFSENCVVDNGTKNYKINSLTEQDEDDNTEDTSAANVADDSKPIETTVEKDNYTTLVKNKKGLLILSAIINSGGASGGNTYAYGGTASPGSTTDTYQFGTGSYGKVRNATYEFVGEKNRNATGAKADFDIAVSDDRTSPSNTNAPYLVQKYTSSQETFNISNNSSKVSFKLTSDGNYDMTGYGNGYQGISARYLSSAVNAGNNINGSVYAKPLVNNFNGQNSKIITDINVKEYADDDYHGISFGGVFNLLRAVQADTTNGTTLLENLYIGTEKTKTNNQLTRVKLQYCNASGANESAATNLEEMSGIYCVGVGGFAGNTAANGVSDIAGDTAKANYFFKQVTIQNGEIIGPNSAGGLFGNVGMGGDAEINANSGISVLLQNVIKNATSETANKNDMGVHLENCTYSDLAVTSAYASGGFIGYLGKNNWNFYDVTKSNLESSFTITEKKYQNAGKNSTIEAISIAEIKPYASNPNQVEKFSMAGGIVGKVNTGWKVNDEEDDLEATFDNNKITSKINAGGVLGQIERNNCIVKKIAVTGSDTAINGRNNAGGTAGYVESNNTETLFDECKATDINVIGASNNTKSGAGGIIGTVKSTGDKKIQIQNCTVSTSEKKEIALQTTDETKVKIESVDTNTNSGVGGILGYLTGLQKVVVQGCSVKNALINTGLKIKGYNGGIVGTMEYNQNVEYCKQEKLSLYDVSVTDTEVYGTEAGGLLSSAYGAVDGSNIQINNVLVTGSDTGTKKTAILIGGAGSAEKVAYLYLAGVSVKGTTWAKVGGNTPSYTQMADSGSFGFGTNSYISFADYTGAALTAKTEETTGNTEETTSSTAGTEKDALLGQTGSKPYVTTSPKSTLTVVDKNGKEKSLFGDGTVWTEENTGTEEKPIIKYKTNGEKIFSEISTSDLKFSYNRTGVTSFSFANAFGTYNGNNSIEAAKNFPVLQVASGDTSSITNYLNILTNGGYSDAVAVEKVSATAELYTYADGKFTYSIEPSPLKITGNGTSGLSYSSANLDYDNDKQRITLLTVTFKTVDDSQYYSVQIPLIVKRVLEVDFTATLSYGTQFKADNYTGLTGHILDSFGNVMTGYLTYTYNCANGEQVRYGWDNYIQAGGNVAQNMEKSVFFNQGQNLPVGTQLTLIDCRDDKKTAYYYTVTEDDSTSKKISFNKFVSSAGNAYASSSIGENLGVSASESEAGTFVETTEEEATVKAKLKDADGNVLKDANGNAVVKYLRLANSTDDKQTKRYSVSAENMENKYSESYYLVVTMPKSADQTAVNGSVETELTGDIPNHINYVLRDGKTTDGHSNSASTYYITEGYSQDLTETLEGSVKQMSAGDSKVNVALKDVISFPKGQYYNESDQLYQSFTGLLQSGSSDNMKASSFPSGTNGKVYFYVYTKVNGKETYYKWNQDISKWEPEDSKNIAVSYDWESDGGNMELPLSTDEKEEHAISLQQIRDAIMANNEAKDDDCKIYIEATLDAAIPANGLSVIPESTIDTTTNNPKEYAKMNYISKLSTERQSLAYTNTKKTLTDTGMKYYREKTDGAKLTYDADNISQLGINLLDLEYNLDKDKKHAVIDTTATYSLADIEDLSDKLKNSTGVEFTLSVKEKYTDEKTESYNEDHPIDAKDHYMNIKIVSDGSTEPTYNNNTNTWTWQIEKDQYWDSTTNMLKTDNVIFNGDTFSQAIRLLVNVDNVESDGHEYANYKVELTAKVLGATGTEKSDYIIYTLTRIKPEFVD